MHHALLAHILADQSKIREAREAAEEAVRLAPDDSGAHSAMTYVLLRDEKWAEAEASARRALSLDADNEVAANHLATALRLQNKMAENADQIRGMLERDPENSFTHTSAGWAALQSGRRADAEKHFLEALRLSPANDSARSGLLEAFKGRSPVYRAYLNYCFFMQRLSRGQRWAVILGLYFFSRFSRVMFTGDMAPIGVTVTVIYLFFVLWSFLARGVGGLLLLFDKLARHVLTLPERLDAIFVGGGVMAGVVLLATGLVTRWFPATLWGATGIIAAIPFSCTFHNDRIPGKILFGTTGLYILAVGIAFGIGVCGNFAWVERIDDLAYWALIAGAATTWLSNVPFLRGFD
jgi:Tfp pilus assembly protein PilF/uncharacterized membrane protein YphA (DoxX/SURF4 family)